jgi:hypothetical protein
MCAQTAKDELASLTVRCARMNLDYRFLQLVLNARRPRSEFRYRFATPETIGNAARVFKKFPGFQD